MRKPSILLGKMGSGNECEVPFVQRMQDLAGLCQALRR